MEPAHVGTVPELRKRIQEVLARFWDGLPQSEREKGTVPPAPDA